MAKMPDSFLWFVRSNHRTGVVLSGIVGRIIEKQVDSGAPAETTHENRFAIIDLKTRVGIPVDGEMRWATNAGCLRRADKERRMPGKPKVPARSPDGQQHHL